MTAQITDRFIYKNEDYDLIGIQGGGLVHPSDFGMKPVMLHTACYRGFYATYELTESDLLLRKLVLKEESGNYLPIEGIEPEKDERWGIYQGLSIAVPFTGRIRLGKDFDDDFYVHMGYQKATAFKTVLDITISGGKVIEVRDRSAEIQAKRGAFKKHYESENLRETIDEAFSLDMDLE